jgi:hypothetical protein
MTLRIPVVPFLFLCCIPAFAQSPSNEPKTIHLCAATPMNLSSRSVDTKWARNMLLRELKFERKEKHSPILIDSTPLDAQEREEALDEAKDKNCDYILLTTVMDPLGAGRLAGTIGPTGIEQRPQMIGNDDPRQHIALTFKLLHGGSPRPVAEGVSTSPAGEDEGTTASTDAMRMVAARVAGEIRKPRVQMPD